MDIFIHGFLGLAAYENYLAEKLEDLDLDQGKVDAALGDLPNGWSFGWDSDPSSWGQPHRGFESLSLRHHFSLDARLSKPHALPSDVSTWHNATVAPRVPGTSCRKRRHRCPPSESRPPPWPSCSP